MEQMPPAALDYFSITDCDDGAVRDAKIEVVPNNPEMARVSSKIRKTALEEIGWQGFDSSQL